MQHQRAHLRRIFDTLAERWRLAKAKKKRQIGVCPAQLFSLLLIEVPTFPACGGEIRGNRGNHLPHPTLYRVWGGWGLLVG